MKRIWIILLTASLLVLAGCGGKEPVAFSGSKESQPPGMETSADSASPVENTALQQESTENIANVKEPAEARTTEYVPAASVTTADENEAPSPEQPSSQPVNEEPESCPSEAEPEPTTPEPQEPPAPSETPPDPRASRSREPSRSGSGSRQSRRSTWARSSIPPSRRNTSCPSRTPP